MVPVYLLASLARMAFALSSIMITLALSHIPLIWVRCAACPNRLVTITALVFGVMLAAMQNGSMVNVEGLISEKTILAPSTAGAAAVALMVHGETMTSLPE